MDFPESTPEPTPTVSPYAPPPVRDNSWAAITSLVIGIISLCAIFIPVCGWFFPIAGLIFGFIGLKSRQRTLSIIGLILSGLLLIVLIVLTIAGVGLSLLDPSVFSGLNY